MGDLSLESSSMQEMLEAEFCPPLDPTIVIALLADHISGGENPTEEILNTLREQLSVLAASAAVDQDDLAKDMRDLHLSAPSATTDDSRDADSVFSQTGLDASTSSASSSEMVSAAHSDSALRFLRALFPLLPPESLRNRLEAGEIDMENIVEDLLSEEYVRELEERGLEDEDLDEELEQWTLVAKKPKHPSRPTNKKRKVKGKTIAINDVLQRQQDRPNPQSHSSGDPWSQVASISSFLETLLDRPSSFFQSYFHKPEYPTPAAAIRAALASIERQQGDVSFSGDKEDEATPLVSLMDFIRASPEFDFDNLDSEAREQLCTDAELSLSTTSSPDAALEIVKLLHELEVDGRSTQEMGLYHSPVKSSMSVWTSSPDSSAVKPVVSAGSAPGSPVSRSTNSTSVTQTPTPPSPVPKQRPPPAPHQNAWQTVRPARPKPPDVHPLAAHIPAYNPNNVPRRKSRPIHSSLANPALSPMNKPGPSNGSSSRGTSVLSGYKARIAESHARRSEALRAASRHWNSGGARNRGGEVAFYYAQEAQRHQAEAQRLQLDALREVVDGKRFGGTRTGPGADTDTIDVHYCTTPEALTIVREVLDEGWVSPARPLHVITGRGAHSSGGVSVLGPAVKKASEQDGWSVGKWDGGISVRGRR